VLVAGVYAGRHWHDNDEPESDPYGIPWPSGGSRCYGCSRYGRSNGKDGEPGPPGPGIKDEILENGMSVLEWIENTDSRLTRVERRSGMSV
jgi:hypothetical protein